MNLSEATTRSFDDRVATDPRTHHVNAGATTPSYLAPEPYPPMPAAPTNRLEQSRYKWTIIALAGMVLILLMALGAVVFIYSRPDPRAAVAPPVMAPPTPEAPEPPEIPEPPPPPEPPEPPDAPAPPPAPDSPSGDQAIGEDLIYPGSEVIGRISAGPGAAVIRLRAKAPVEDVIRWYEQRLSGEKVVKSPGGNAVINQGTLAIIIKPEAGGTNIMLSGALSR